MLSCFLIAAGPDNGAAEKQGRALVGSLGCASLVALAGQVRPAGITLPPAGRSALSRCAERWLAPATWCVIGILAGLRPLIYGGCAGRGLAAGWWQELVASSSVSRARRSRLVSSPPADTGSPLSSRRTETGNLHAPQPEQLAATQPRAFGDRRDQRGAAVCHALTVCDEQGPGPVAADEILVGAHEGPAGPGSACTEALGSQWALPGMCAGRSAAAPRRQALGSVSGSFTAVRRRSLATAGIVSALVTNAGGRW